MVDEEHAVEMVHLVLQAGREQAVGLDLPRLALAIEEADANPGGPLHLGIVVWDRQASLLVDGALVRGAEDFRVEEDLRGPGLALLGEVDDHQPDRLADLDRRQAYARRVVHRLQHVVDEPAQAVVEALDGFGDLAKHWIGQDYEGSDGHRPHVIICVAGVNGDGAPPFPF
jgi:hypothetical protein